MAEQTILIIDDDQDIINALQAILENQHFRVICANNKTDGMNMVKSARPDLIILDVMMDSMSDGFDLSRDLKSKDEFRNIPILLYTGIDNKTGVNFKSAYTGSDEIKADGYLEKPVTPAVLITAVNGLINRKV